MSGIYCSSMSSLNYYNWRDAIPAAMALMILFWSYCTYVVQYCLFLQPSFTKKLVYLVLFHIFFLCAIAMYFVTMCNRESFVPNEYYLPPEIFQKLAYARSIDEEYRLIVSFCRTRGIVVYTRTQNGHMRICNKCKVLKPDRAHHCSTCETCVLRMDHHCPWINNCVGFTNYKFFLMMLLYFGIFCFFYVGSLTEYIIFFFKEFQVSFLIHLDLVVMYLMGVLTGVTVTALFCYHLRLICINATTLEAMIPPNFPFSFPATFDKGCRDNFDDVCGWNVLYWCLPVDTMVGDGLSYEVRRYIY